MKFSYKKYFPLKQTYPKNIVIEERQEMIIQLLIKKPRYFLGKDAAQPNPRCCLCFPIQFLVFHQVDFLFYYFIVDISF